MNNLSEQNLVLKLAKMFNIFYFSPLNILICVNYVRRQRSKATNSLFVKCLPLSTRAGIIVANSVIYNKENICLVFLGFLAQSF